MSGLYLNALQNTCDQRLFLSLGAKVCYMYLSPLRVRHVPIPAAFVRGCPSGESVEVNFETRNVLLVRGYVVRRSFIIPIYLSMQFI